ncbi:hypothetical protein T439DRAFT_352805 [Meredithblackwellia eburnea MCA 4105]
MVKLLQIVPKLPSNQQRITLIRNISSSHPKLSSDAQAPPAAAAPPPPAKEGEPTLSVHEAQAFAKQKAIRDIAARQRENSLLKRAVQQTADNSQQAEDFSIQQTTGNALPQAGGRWVIKPKPQQTANPLSNKFQKMRTAREESPSGLARRLLQRRKESGEVYDADARAIAAQASHQTPYQRSSTPRPSNREPYVPRPLAMANSDRSIRSPSSYPSPSTPRGPRTSPTKTGGGGPRKFPSSSSSSRRPRPSNSDTLAHYAKVPELEYPTNVVYPSLDVAALIRRDLENRALRLRTAVQVPKNEGGGEADVEEGKKARLARKREHQGDYSRWKASRKGKGPLSAAEQLLTLNPTVSLEGREKVLKELEKLML